jgi:hypothetical protein
MRVEGKDYDFKFKNLGIDANAFDKFFMIRTEKIRKIYSDSAINEIDPSKALQNKRYRETDDIYEGVENDYNPFGEGSLGEHFNQVDDEAETISDCSENAEERELTVTNSYDIFQNCSQTHIDKLNQLVSHHQNQAKILVKAYKSKLKSKHQDIYRKNSEDFMEQIKHKVFHKCNFPGCSRTFASAGWLKSHFNEHDSEILRYKFNSIFDSVSRRSGFGTSSGTLGRG